MATLASLRPGRQAMKNVLIAKKRPRKREFLEDFQKTNTGFGHKEVYLPNFTLTLLRTPYMPARFATFIVPLNLNKLDVKDYLYHVYNIKTRSIRSFVQQSKVRQDKPGAKIPKQRRWYRPRAIKKMTVEMTQPFVWPEVPEDLTPWDKKRYDAVRKLQEDDRDSRGPDAVMKPTVERKSIAEQAKRLLEGKDQWKSAWDGASPSTL